MANTRGMEAIVAKPVVRLYHAGLPHGRRPMIRRVPRAIGLALIGLAPVLARAQAPNQVPDTIDDERHRGVEWHAAAGFFMLGSMTVVYPAGPGEPVELNRRSAEARAAWLTTVHKNKVAVVADDQLTEEQKKGNLLILGWKNRAFNIPGLQAPFAREGSVTRFAGMEDSDPAADLLLFNRNPLNWSMFVLFWSRIDPERDRFQVIPRLGSDWAIYHDFRPIHQGMFLPGRVWPPRRDVDAEADHTSEGLSAPGASASMDSPHYHVVFERKSFTDEELAKIVKAREAAFAKAVASLGPVPPDFKILLYLYENEDMKREGTGVGDPTHAVPASREIHATKRYAMSVQPVEEFHVIARQNFGPCFLSSLYEGVPFSFLDRYRDETMEGHAAILRSNGGLPTLDVLLDEERFRSIPSDEAGIMAGVFVLWLRQSFGEGVLKKTYGVAGGTSAPLAAALGTSPDALSKSFTSWADGRVAAHKSELDFLAAEREAQDKRLSSDWKGMVVALQKALKAKPADPQTLFNLASAQMRADDFAGAEASLKGMLAGKLGPEDSTFKIFGHYQLGRVYDLAGRRREALAEYDTVLALPDDHGAHALAQERKQKPATKEQLQ